MSRMNFKRSTGSGKLGKLPRKHGHKHPSRFLEGQIVMVLMVMAIVMVVLVMVVIMVVVIVKRDRSKARGRQKLLKCAKLSLKATNRNERTTMAPKGLTMAQATSRKQSK